ncbi:MAG: helix-turn-helix domain-containing protein [Allorhizobium sp.]
MSDITDETLVLRLKELLAMSGTKLTDLSESIGVPYRTLQNQFAGSSKMPAVTLLKVLDALQVTSAHLDDKIHTVNEVALGMALRRVFGDDLPKVEINDSVDIDMAPEGERSPEEMSRSALILATLISRNYAEQELANMVAQARKRNSVRKGSQ